MLHWRRLRQLGFLPQLLIWEIDVTETIVIVGGGQAALQIADSVRREGYEGELLMYSEESSFPYQRPPLSKGFLSGTMAEDKLHFRKMEFYEKRDIQVILNTRVTRLDADRKMLHLQGGDSKRFDRVALATGTRVRSLPVPGADSEGVHYLRTLADTQKIKTALAHAQNVVVVGGGFIGLEVAASASKLGKTVTCIEAQDRLLARVVSPSISDFYQRVHSERGTQVILNTQVSEIANTDGLATAVRCGDGSEYAADLVVIGIGVIPNQELAQEAGLECSNGIVVDEFAKTSDPNIVSAGDCTFHPNPYANSSIRLESVQNAIDQSKTAAATLVGLEKPYHAVPWFWSDQYDLKLQIVGLSDGADREVLRGSMGDSKFSLFYFKGDKLLAIDSVNSPGDHLLGRKLIGQGIAVGAEQVADSNFDLKSLLK